MELNQLPILGLMQEPSANTASLMVKRSPEP
jgi:hypothetical protein